MPTDQTTQSKNQQVESWIPFCLLATATACCATLFMVAFVDIIVAHSTDGQENERESITSSLLNQIPLEVLLLVIIPTLLCCSFMGLQVMRLSNTSHREPPQQETQISSLETTALL